MRFRIVSLAVFLACVAVCVVGCTTGESYSVSSGALHSVNKVAVVRVDGALGSDVAKDQIADFFAMELIKKGYKPVERTQINAIITEQGMQHNALTSSKNVAEIGKILNVDAVVVVNISSWGEKIDMTAKILDAEDGSVLWIGSGSGGTNKTLGALIGAGIGAGAGVAAAGGDSGDKAAGAAIGGIAGGVVGHALSPSEAKAAKRVIKKMMETLPIQG